jgi:hypothetical protein
MNNNQDIFSSCLADMAASLELVSELENELGNVQNQSGGKDSELENQKYKKTEPRAWAI